MTVFVVEDIIEDAYNLANIKSLLSGDTLSANEVTKGLNVLSQIIHSLMSEPFFSPFLRTLEIDNTSSNEIWIGRDIDTVNTSVQVINDNPFQVIYSAFYKKDNDNLLYNLKIRPYADYGNIGIDYESSYPVYLYYTNVTQINTDETYDNYTRIILYPTSTNLYLTLIGSSQLLDSNGDVNQKVIPSLELYLKYALAYELAALYGKTDEFDKTSKVSRMRELYRNIKENLEILPQVEDNSSLFRRNTIFNW
jgi:hypothetical protein